MTSGIKHMPENNSHSQTVPIVAGILVGGKSRRMGRPKALIKLATGQTLIEQSVGVARQIAEEVVILGRASELPEPLTTLAVLDDQKPNGGPLAGLCSLLKYADRRWGLLLACDMPHLTETLIRRLCDHLDPEVDAVVFHRLERPGSYHACCGLYHPRIAVGTAREPASPARQVLFEGDASLNTLLKKIRVQALTPTSEETRQLWNVNSPEDLAELGQF